MLVLAVAGCSSFSSSSSSSSSASAAATDSPGPPPAHDPREDVYPTVSLIDLFKSEPAPAAAGAAPPRTASVPHAPSSYTPADQPYVQSSAPAAAAAPANSDSAASSLPYPQQSIGDLFRRDAGGQ